MMTRWHPLTKLLILLAFPALGWLVWTTGGGSEVVQVRRAGTSGVGAEDLAIEPMVVQRRVLPALQTFAAMVERPVFTPSRRLVRPVEPAAEAEPLAEPEPVAEAEPTIDRPDLRFFGTVRQRDRVTALVTHGAGGSMEQLAVGASVEEWQVAEVTRDRLVLTLDDRRAVYAIFGAGDAEPAEGSAGGGNEEAAPDDGGGADDEQE